MTQKPDNPQALYNALETIQKQREVLGMAREVIAWMDSRIPEPEDIGIGDDGHPEYINDENHGWAWEKHRLGEALTAIDNVMKGA